MAAVLDPCQNYSRNSGVVVTRAAATIELVELVFGIDPCRRGSAIHSRRRIQKAHAVKLEHDQQTSRSISSTGKCN
ncbi:uncharacterized protein LOC143215137 isoform X2 [Lasioglossum baleicum]|uniref:uncharacterized protein LOC143215137 isoform X2 n=1 Tax=Lasioglossum baleicum TaxID=434251 RepID=UPI003FCC7E34